MKKNASKQHPLGSHFDSQSSPRRSIPSAPPSQDTCKIDRDRAENEGMVPPAAKPKPKPVEAEVEGEGSYSAARRYREALERSLKQGDVNALAAEAAEALDGPEGLELRRAEKAARHGRFEARQHHFSHSHH